MLDAILIVHAASSWFMTGLVWFVQVVHYPLFARVGEDQHTAYHASHQSRTTLIVAPVMLVEAITAMAIVASHAGLLAPRGDLGVLPWAGLALLGVVWASTFLVQVPLHARLARGHRGVVVRALLLSNWLRTLAWTARGVVAGALLAA